MKLKQWIKLAMIGCGVVALAACSSAKKDEYDRAAIDDANSAYSERDHANADDDEGAQSSGMGEHDRFAGSHLHNRDLLSKRVYHFDFDSNIVRADDRPAIVANANWLVAHASAKAIVEGHTDPRGSREYNIGLGERRAKAVAEILTANGVSRKQIRVVSYGAQKLASPGHSESDYQQDRRAVLIYLKQ